MSSDLDLSFCEVLKSDHTNVGKFEVGTKICGARLDLILGIEKGYFREIPVDHQHEDFDIDQWVKVTTYGGTRDKSSLSQGKSQIVLTRDNKEIHDLARQIITHWKNKDNFPFFFRPKFRRIVEVVKEKDPKSGVWYNMFVDVTIPRMINILQSTIDFVRQDDSATTKKENIKESVARLLMCNDEFIRALPRIQRILTYNIAYIHQGVLEFTKTGYNKESEIYVTDDAPDLLLMDVTKAKEMLKDMLSGFCFKSDTDRCMAFAYLITPFARGFYESTSISTPIFMIKANRERAGKDYLAGCIGIIYEGEPTNFPPISTGGQADNDELRKRVFSVALKGGRRYHSQNNKGHINSAYLEMIITSPSITDRILGKTDTVTIDNELEFSLSCNIGTTYTPDLMNRSRAINLFYAEEDANSRIFKKPNLHQEIKDGRKNFLGAIFTLYKTWYDAGSPKGGVFTSFPEWARVVGGVMEYHKLGDPTVKLMDDEVGGDTETLEMKKLYVACFTKFQKDGKAMPCKQSDISEVAKTEEIFPHFYEIKRDKEGDVKVFGKGASVKLGIITKKFVNRDLNGIKLTRISGPDIRTDKAEYQFIKIDPQIILPNATKTESSAYPESKPILTLHEAMLTLFPGDRESITKILEREANIDELGSLIGNDRVKYYLEHGDLMQTTSDTVKLTSL